MPGIRFELLPYVFISQHTADKIMFIAKFHKLKERKRFESFEQNFCFKHVFVNACVCVMSVKMHSRLSRYVCVTKFCSLNFFIIPMDLFFLLASLALLLLESLLHLFFNIICRFSYTLFYFLIFYFVFILFFDFIALVLVQFISVRCIQLL